MNETTVHKAYETVVPTKQETSLAERSIEVLHAYEKSTKHPTLELLSKGRRGAQITIPASALRLLVTILTQMAKGNAVTLIPVHAELTTQEAADMLNVSRPYLVDLVEQGKILFHKVGTRRRIYVKDLLLYKNKIDKERLKALEELTKQAQEQDMGY